MNPLHRLIAEQIAQTGPISLADYMALCLQHPEHGYYITRDPLGQDFITAPEISQMFGELIGLCLVQSWMDQGAPTRFTLAEFGPGRGTLMADALRAAKQVPAFVDAADIVLVESSPVLRAAQADTLKDWDVSWCDLASELPQQPLFFIANEFFDALPIRQFERGEGAQWHERRIGTQDDGSLCFGLAGGAPVPALADRLEDTKKGDLVETCTAAEGIMQDISTSIQSHGGAGLVIDYGDWRAQGDTFQAMAQGAAVDPLSDPGTADLTAHVDFEALAQAAPSLAFSKLTPQGVFLERLGITQRAQALARNLSGAALETHIAAHRRLTSPTEMGNLFKVLGVTTEGAPPPAGLEA